MLDSGLKRFAQFWWSDRGFSALLFLLLLVSFLAPFFELSLARFLFSVFLVVLLISGVATVTERRMLRMLASVIAGLAVVFSILHQVTPTRGITGLWYLSTLAFFSILIAVLLKRVFREGPVTSHRILGAIAVYLLIGMTWAIIYQLIALFVVGAFSFPSSMTAKPGDPEHESTLVYFSFVTMATLGYGDIVPVSPVARMFAIFEALVGLLFPATLLARLVSLAIIHRNEGQR